MRRIGLKYDEVGLNLDSDRKRSSVVKLNISDTTQTSYRSKDSWKGLGCKFDPIIDYYIGKKVRTFTSKGAGKFKDGTVVCIKEDIDNVPGFWVILSYYYYYC